MIHEQNGHKKKIRSTTITKETNGNKYDINNCTSLLYLILQEAGNVPYVTENKFGLYRQRPADIAHEVSDLLADREKLEEMGAHARALGRPRASLDIARSIVSNLMPGIDEHTQSSSRPASSSSSSS